MKYIFFFVLALIATSLFLTIEWFTIWAWISLSTLITFFYDCFCVSQENNMKLTRASLEAVGKLEQQCTRMSTIMGEIRDNEYPKKRFDSSKFKKK
jgi:hypothetical protein